jgi:multiple sugar transport system permease protein
MSRARSHRLGSWIVNGSLAAAALLTSFPLLWMISASLMAPGEASANPPPLFPAHATLGNYRELFARAAFTSHLGNSLVLAIAATVLSLTFNVSAGYAFACASSGATRCSSCCSRCCWYLGRWR